MIHQQFRDVIRANMAKHLENGGFILGQNLTDVGWVAGTLPEWDTHSGYVELPIADVAGPGIAVGVATSGRPSIYIVRYSGYLWFNLAPLATYGSVFHSVYGQDCPLLFRVISDDGPLGPIAGGVWDSLALQARKVNVFCPILSEDWVSAWNHWETNRAPTIVLEYRPHFDLSAQLERPQEDPEVVILAVGATYLSMVKIQDDLLVRGIRASLHRVTKLKPLELPDEAMVELRSCSTAVISDPGDALYGIGAAIAFRLVCLFPEIDTLTLSTADAFSGYAPEVASSRLDAQDGVESILKWLDQI